MNRIKAMLISLGSLDRRIIFFIVGLSVLIPLLKPNWVSLPIKNNPHSERVFHEINSLKPNSKVLLSFDYGPSTMPEIHPMAIALLRHMFAKDIKVYGIALWDTGNFMSTDAFSQLSKEFEITYDKDYVNLGYKPGGEAVIQGLTSDFRTKYKSDLLGNNLNDLFLMKNVNNLEDFDFIISLSAGDPGSKQWVQFGSDPSGLEGRHFDNLRGYHRDMRRIHHPGRVLSRLQDRGPEGCGCCDGRRPPRRDITHGGVRIWHGRYHR